MYRDCTHAFQAGANKDLQNRAVLLQDMASKFFMISHRHAMSLACCCSSQEACGADSLIFPSGSYTTIGYGADAAPQVSVIVAKLDLRLGSNIGIAFDAADKAIPVVKEVYGGLIAHWNSTAGPEMEVKAFDQLVAVNGEAGSKSELFSKLTQKKEASEGPLELKFRRPKEVKAVLQRAPGQQLGFTINYFKSSIKLTVAGIDPDGLVPDWNVAHPDAKICLNDHIIAINGLRDTAANMAGMLGAAESLELTLLRY
eukprot:s1038_g6.t3